MDEALRQAVIRKLRANLQGQPIYDEMGRIVGLADVARFSSPADRSEQALAQMTAGTAQYEPPLQVRPSLGPEQNYWGALSRTLFLRRPNPSQLSEAEKAKRLLQASTEENKKRLLIQYFANLLRNKPIGT